MDALRGGVRGWEIRWFTPGLGERLHFGFVSGAATGKPRGPMEHRPQREIKHIKLINSAINFLRDARTFFFLGGGSFKRH